MMNIDFISLPRIVRVPFVWTETPDPDQVKANQVAQSFFATWADERLGRSNFALNIGKVVSLIGIGVSILFVSIPGVILSGAALTICMIGSSAVRREQVVRAQQVCLDVENWCKQFTQACEHIKAELEVMINLHDDTDDLDDKNFDKLLEVLNELPPNDLENMRQKLKDCHLQLFGEKRKIGSGTWSIHWIEHDLKLGFGTNLNLFYIEANVFKGLVQKKDNSKGFNVLAKVLLNHLIEKKKEAKAPDSIHDKTKMFLLTDRFDIPLQGQEEFAHLIEQAEYWRQNIAIFRSSLD